MNLISILIWLALCADQDARKREISNWLTLGTFALALVFLLTTGRTWTGADSGAGGWALLLSLALTLPGYALGKLGAGDVKLLAALAVATDSRFLLGTFIGAGLSSLSWLLSRQKLNTLANQWVSNRYPQTNETSSSKHPFAPHLFVGFFLTAAWIS